MENEQERPETIPPTRTGRGVRRRGTLRVAGLVGKGVRPALRWHSRDSACCDVPGVTAKLRAAGDVWGQAVCAQSNVFPAAAGIGESLYAAIGHLWSR
jgi:hypothetical protein